MRLAIDVGNTNIVLGVFDGPELGGEAICVATGGLAPIIAPETHVIHHVDPNLTRQGFRIVWTRNQVLHPAS